MKVAKNKYLTDCVPFLLGFCILVYVSSSLFFGCAAKTHQGKVSPDVIQGNQHLPDANSVSVDVEGLSISNQACSAIGNEVIFTVSMHNAPNPASALGFEVIYDENVLEYKSFAKGDLSQKFDMFDLSHTGTNTLRAGGVIAQGEIAKGQGGTLVELTFTIKQCIPASLKLDNLTDDLKGWPVHPGQLIVDEKGNGSAKGVEDSKSGSKEREKTSASENLEKQSENSKTNDPRNLHISSSETITKNEGGSNSPDSTGMDNSKQNSEQANQTNTSTLVFSPKKFSEDTSLASRTEESKSAPALGNSISGHYTATLANTNPATGQSDAKNVINLTNIGTDQSDPKTRKSPDPLPGQPTITPTPKSDSPEKTPEQAQGGSLTIADQSCSGASEDVTFSISAGDVSNKVAALGLEVKYDENILDYTGFTRGNLTQGFSMFDVVRQQPGTLRIGGIDIAATNIVQGATGTIASLTFKTKKCETTRLSLTNLHDDLKGWSSQSGQLQGGSAEQGAGLK